MSSVKFLLKSVLPGFLALLLCACAPLHTAPAALSIQPCDATLVEEVMQIPWQRVGHNIWLHPGKPDALSTPLNRGRISNVVFVLDQTSTDTHGWLVGSGPDAETGRALACGVQRSLGVTVTDLISARAHPESVLGAAGLPHVRHWALPQVQATMTERCERCLKRLEVAVNANTPLVPRVSLPEHLINGLQLGPFEVMPIEVQPQQFVTLLYHRASDTWILPGLVWGQGIVPDLREADALQMLHSLERLTLRQPQRIVPEQGPVGDGALITQNITYWKRLLESLNARWLRGESQPENASGLPLPEGIRANPEARLRDQLNAQRAWQQIENSGFDPARVQ